MRYLTACFVLLTAALAHGLTPEGSFVVGQGTQQVTVLGTGDFARIQPVFAGFVQRSSDHSVRYIQASSREIDQAVRAGLPPEIDVVMSSAVDLQVRLINDGFGQSLSDELTNSTNWRGELIQWALEPIVTLVNRRLVGDDVDRLSSRSALIQWLKNQERSGLTATLYDPRQSGVGYLLSQQDLLQDTQFWELIDQLARHQLRPNCCSGDMIDQVVSGESALAYNVIESYVTPRLERAPDIRILRFNDYQLAIPRTGFVPREANDRDLALDLLAYFVSDEGQARLSPTVRLAVLNRPNAGGPIKPIRLSPALIVHLDPVARDDFFRVWDQRSQRAQ